MIKLTGKKVLITGSGIRIGREMAIAVAKEGGDIFLHYFQSRLSAERLSEEIKDMGREVYLLHADLRESASAVKLIDEARSIAPIYAVVNNAAIFKPLYFKSTTLNDWEEHMKVNLTAPFLLSQAFAAALEPGEHGRIVNILDWRALRPGIDHFPYTISKAALAALTQSMAVALAPSITVNGLAFGAILPPSDGGSTKGILEDVPAGRWANLDEVSESLLFLLTGPSYITGEIIHLDGGRHLI
jgi:NAD(P)-dependent dehydrogenase (short-subunit alcohol dehydrogenase family)